MSYLRMVYITPYLQSIIEDYVIWDYVLLVEGA